MYTSSGTVEEVMVISVQALARVIVQFMSVIDLIPTSSVKDPFMRI